MIGFLMLEERANSQAPPRGGIGSGGLLKVVPPRFRWSLKGYQENHRDFED